MLFDSTILLCIVVSIQVLHIAAPADAVSIIAVGCKCPLKIKKANFSSIDQVSIIELNQKLWLRVLVFYLMKEEI
jgi:hypothetical protein